MYRSSAVLPSFVLLPHAPGLWLLGIWASGPCTAARGLEAAPNHPVTLSSKDGGAGCSSSTSSRSRQLPTAIQLHVLSLLPPNERALSGRFVCREAADAFSEPQHCTASLSQPLPPHAAPWAIDAGQQHVIQLPFEHKPLLLSTTACIGSKVNLEVAWALLEPSIFPELLQIHQDTFWADRMMPCDPGVTAVKAGHPQLLGWLVRRCPVLQRPGDVLAAAVEHCDLAGLQAAWEAVGNDMCSRLDRDSSYCSYVTALGAAVQSALPDAVAKAEWMLGKDTTGYGTLRHTVESALLSGDPRRLRWLLDHGVVATWKSQVLPTRVLEQLSLDKVQLLVDEAGCRLPEPGVSSGQWEPLLQSAARSSDGVAKLRWLQQRGAPPLGSDEQLLQGVVMEATKAGQEDALRYILDASGPGVVLRAPQGELGTAAARSGSIATATLLRQTGLVFGAEAYEAAARAGSVDMVRWLATEAGVPADGVKIRDVMCWWPDTARSDRRNRLDAVAELVGAGYRSWDEESVLSFAMVRGDLALVQYLYGLQQQQQQPGCWLEEEAVSVAVFGGCEALLEWLAAQPGGLSGGEGGDLYLWAAKRGDRGTMAALRRLGVPWGLEQMVARAVFSGTSLAAVCWLVEHGAPVGSREALVSALRFRWHYWDEPVEWLLSLADPAGDDGDGVIDLTSS